MSSFHSSTKRLSSSSICSDTTRMWRSVLSWRSKISPARLIWASQRICSLRSPLLDAFSAEPRLLASSSCLLLAERFSRNCCTSISSALQLSTAAARSSSSRLAEDCSCSWPCSRLPSTRCSFWSHLACSCCSAASSPSASWHPRTALARSASAPRRSSHAGSLEGLAWAHRPAASDNACRASASSAAAWPAALASSGSEREMAWISRVAASKRALSSSASMGPRRP
mmetsp:Transcript_96825/g.252373  ORF Transcript_96825/g.252373 Transcript_96825/m.252373 type:complete len:227 (+) Transcript_96825:477-1157(+)